MRHRAAAARGVGAMLFAFATVAAALALTASTAAGGVYHATARVYLVRDHKAGEVVDCSGAADGSYDRTLVAPYHIRYCNERVR